MAAGDLTVGEVLSLLQGDFPEATMGWIRSLEDEHLIVPARTPKGNRLFAPTVIDTLRWILTEQRNGATPQQLRSGLSKSASEARDKAVVDASEQRLFDDPSDILPPVTFDDDGLDDDGLDDTDDADDADITDDGEVSDSEGRGGAVQGEFSMSRTTTENDALVVQGRGADVGRSALANRTPAPNHPAEAARRRSSERSATNRQSESPRQTSEPVSSARRPAAASERSRTESRQSRRPAVRPDAPRSSTVAAASSQTSAGQPRAGQPSASQLSGADPVSRRGSSLGSDLAGDSGSKSEAGQATTTLQQSPSTEREAVTTRDTSHPRPASAGPISAGPASAGTASTGSNVSSGQGDGSTERAARSDDRRLAADAVAALQEPPSAPDAPAVEDRPRPARIREVGSETAPSELLTREEFLSEVGLSAEILGTLELYGVLSPVTVGGFYYYDEQSVRVGRVASEFSVLGLEARHLRMYRMAAEREVALLEQLALPLLKQRNPVGREQAKQTLRDAADLGAELHAALVAEGIRELLGGPGG